MDWEETTVPCCPLYRTSFPTLLLPTKSKMDLGVPDAGGHSTVSETEGGPCGPLAS